jgi:hypothetical protein
MTRDVDNRGPCYCDLWVTSPETLRSQNIPHGFCGSCIECGKPGHLRHSPEGPFTVAMCDAHFDAVIARMNGLTKLAE